MKSFIIHLSKIESSLKTALAMKTVLDSYGMENELFEGSYGNETLNRYQQMNRRYHPWNFKGGPTQIISDEYRDSQKSPGEIGCFDSHFRLWEKCVELNEPILIFEDDVKFYRGWIPIDWDDILVLSLGKQSFYGEPWKTYLENPSGNPQPMSWRNFSMPGASGYAIKPHAAKGLVKFYKQYFYPADNAINQFLCQIQIHNYIMGRNTLPEEGNISMTRSKGWQ